jgi:hypothetical protein
VEPIVIKRLFVVVAALATVALASETSALASTITIGSPLTAAFTPTAIGGGSTATTSLNSSLGEPGAQVASPVTGAIIRWRIIGASGGPFTLRVLTPLGGTTFAGAGTSGPGTPTSTGLQTFAAHLPIQAGQVIGLDNTRGADTIGVATVSGSNYVFWHPRLADGQSSAGNGPVAGEYAFNADVQPVPGITSISPASGSISANDTVTITGHDFTSTSAVKFGALPAKSFTVNSDTSITAVSPKVPAAATVDVRVTTVAGESPLGPGDRFTYTECVVPKLKHKKLKKAKKALKKANCTLGKVKGHKGKKHKVKKQDPKPGTILPAGSTVTVKLK